MVSIASLLNSKIVTSELIYIVINVEEGIRGLLEILSPLEPQKQHQEIRLMRLDNTGKWLLEQERFRAWSTHNSIAQNSCDRVFYCHGIPGAGKKVMRYVTFYGLIIYIS